MIKSTVELLKEAREDLEETLDYIASEYGCETNIYQWLQPVEDKLKIIYARLAHPVAPQTNKKASDFEEVKAYLEAGKLPPIDGAKCGIQYRE